LKTVSLDEGRARVTDENSKEVKEILSGDGKDGKMREGSLIRKAVPPPRLELGGQVMQGRGTLSRV
jgi:hypothetical protein